MKSVERQLSETTQTPSTNRHVKCSLLPIFHVMVRSFDKVFIVSSLLKMQKSGLSRFHANVLVAVGVRVCVCVSMKPNVTG